VLCCTVRGKNKLNTLFSHAVRSCSDEKRLFEMCKHTKETLFGANCAIECRAVGQSAKFVPLAKDCHTENIRNCLRSSKESRQNKSSSVPPYHQK